MSKERLTRIEQEERDEHERKKKEAEKKKHDIEKAEEEARKRREEDVDDSKMVSLNSRISSPASFAAIFGFTLLKLSVGIDGQL